jgi:hypothetical protein
MAHRDARNDRAVKRRIAATAATAALAAEVGGSAAAARIERGLEAAEAEIGSAYSRGERPQFADGLPVALVESSGLSEAKLAEAFESMSRHALQRRRGTRA